MKVLFMGSGTFGLPVLDALLVSRHPILAVVTAPDKPQGRGRVMTPSPVKDWADPNGVRVLTPAKINQPEAIAELKEIGAEVFVVASYGALLSREVLALPSGGCINVHPSLLPKHRGASPVVQTLLDGEKRAGMTIMVMAAELDAGDILLQEPVDIGEDENARGLTDRLAKLGGRMTVQALDLIETGQTRRTPQNNSQATYCSKLKKEDARLDWAWSAQRIHDRVRALAIWPGTVTRWNARDVKILKTRLGEEAASQAGPGEVLEISSTNGIRVQTGKETIWLLELHPEGSRPMNHRDFVNGHNIRLGAVFA